MDNTEPTDPTPATEPDTQPVPQPTPQDTPQPTPAPEPDAQPVIADLYALGADPEPGADTPPAPATPEPEYTIAWPETFKPSDTFSAMATQAAKEAGLDGAAAGAYTAAVWQQLQQQEQQRLAESHAALKTEWGADFEGNLAGAKNMLRQLKASAHVDEEAAQLLQSPKGMKLLHGLASFVGERPAAGIRQAAPDASNWAHEVMTNPAHPDYNAFHNPSDPRWREVNARYNTIRYGLR